MTLLSSNFLSYHQRYISSLYQLRSSDLVFLNLNHIEKNLTEEQTIKEAFFVSPPKSAGNASQSRSSESSFVDSMCIMELSSTPSTGGTERGSVAEPAQLPLINIIGINVYHESESRRLVCHGLPFVLVINRDCSYSALCRKLLEAQSKYFKDKGMLKYKDLVEKLFTLSLSSDSLQQHTPLNAADELPLYAECVEQALNDSQLPNRVADQPNNEYIKLHIEWKSFDGISK